MLLRARVRGAELQAGYVVEYDNRRYLELQGNGCSRLQQSRQWPHLPVRWLLCGHLSGEYRVDSVVQDAGVERLLGWDPCGSVRGHRVVFSSEENRL